MSRKETPKYRQGSQELIDAARILLWTPGQQKQFPKQQKSVQKLNEQRAQASVQINKQSINKRVVLSQELPWHSLKQDYVELQNLIRKFNATPQTDTLSRGIFKKMIIEKKQHIQKHKTQPQQGQKPVQKQAVQSRAAPRVTQNRTNIKNISERDQRQLQNLEQQLQWASVSWKQYLENAMADILAKYKPVKAVEKKAVLKKVVKKKVVRKPIVRDWQDILQATAKLTTKDLQSITKLTGHPFRSEIRGMSKEQFMAWDIKQMSARLRKLPTSIRRAISWASKKYWISEVVIKSKMCVESSCGRNLTSRVWANGYMQLMPWTLWEMIQQDPYIASIKDPRVQNIYAGTRYLSKMMKRYNGNLNLASAAYNAGPWKITKAMINWRAKFEKAETRRHVAMMLAYIKAFA